MLIQPQDVDRLTHAVPERFRTFNPFSLTVRSGDLSDRQTRTEYVHNVYGTWRRVTRNDHLFDDDH